MYRLRDQIYEGYFLPHSAIFTWSYLELSSGNCCFTLSLKDSSVSVSVRVLQNRTSWIYTQRKRRIYLRNWLTQLSGLTSLKSIGWVGQLKTRAVSMSQSPFFTGTSAFCSVWGLLILWKVISCIQSLLIINVNHNYKVHSKQILDEYLT